MESHRTLPLGWMAAYAADRPFRVGSCGLVLQGFVADAGHPNRLRYGSSPTFIVGNHAAGHTDSLGGLIQSVAVDRATDCPDFRKGTAVFST